MAAPASRRTAGRPWGPLVGDDPAARNVAAYLRQLINGAGLTLRQLAVTCDCSPTTISARLNGQQLPGDTFVERVIRACVPDDRRARAVMANLATIRQTSARATPRPRKGGQQEYDDPRSRIIRAQGETVSVLHDLAQSQQAQIDMQRQLIEAERYEKLAALKIAGLEAEIVRLQNLTAEATRLRDLYLAQAQHRGTQLHQTQGLLVAAHQREDQAGRQLATATSEQQHAAREVARIKATLKQFEHLVRTLPSVPATRPGLTDASAAADGSSAIDSLAAELGHIDEALRRIEVDLSTSARWVGHAIRAMAEAVVVTDIAGIIVSCNPAAEKLFGRSALGAIGLPWVQLCVAPSAVPAATELHRTAVTGHDCRETLVISAADGRLPTVSLRAVPLRAEGMDGVGAVEGVVLLAGGSEQDQSFVLEFAEQINLLSRARQALAVSADPVEVLSAIAALLTPVFDDWCQIVVVDSEGPPRPLITVHNDGEVEVADADADTATAGPFPSGFPVGHPYAEAIRSQQPVVEAPGAGESDLTVTGWGLKGLPANVSRFLAIPLRAARAVRGVLAVASANRPAYSDDDLALIEELATRCGLALEIAALDQSREQAWMEVRDASVELQHAMLPTRVPELHGASVAVAYTPDLWNPGGDLYDVFPLPTGRIGVLIGDVAGRGLYAAAAMGQLRATVRSYAMLDVRPAELLAHVSDILGSLEGEQERLSTLLYAVYDPFTRRCTLANAGHPPPLLLVDVHGCYPMEVPADLPLGIGRGEYADHIFSLPPASTMVLYTDGVVETRAHGIDLGVRRLCESLEESPAELVTLCDTALHRASRDAAHDDRAVVVLRTDPGDLPYSETQIKRSRQASDLVRAHVRQVLAQWGLQGSATDAEALVGELVDNAVQHAVRPGGAVVTDMVGSAPVLSEAVPEGAGTDLTVALKRGSGSLWIEVHDDDPRLPVLSGLRGSAAGLEATSTGLLRVDSLARRWGSRRTHAGKVVWCEIAVHSAPEPPLQRAERSESGDCTGPNE